MDTVAELRKMSVGELETEREKIKAKIEKLKTAFKLIGLVKEEKLAVPRIKVLKERKKVIDANLKTLGAG